MGTRLFVGNVSYETTEQTLRSHFEQRGWNVTDVVIVTDRDTGRSRGFGFVEIGQASDAERAKEVLDGEELDGRRLTVREAFERTPRRRPQERREPAVERIGQIEPPTIDGWARNDDELMMRAFETPIPKGRGRQTGGRRRRRAKHDWTDDDW